MSAISPSDYVDQEMGRAWRECVDALPEGCSLSVSWNPDGPVADANMEDDWGDVRVHMEALSMVAALDALTVALRDAVGRT